MTRRCDRCGHPAADAIGTRQASLFDVAPADPRATDEARAELRTGRILCAACQRTDDLPGMREAEAAQIADFYAEQEEQDRDADAYDARQIDAARARLAEQDRIARIPRAVLDEQRAEAVRRAQDWHDNHEGK